MCFCQQRKFDPTSPIISNVLEFLVMLYKRGLGYSSVNSARSAVSNFFSTCGTDVAVGKHYLIKRFMRGIFILRPALPKYNCTWNVSKVLCYLQGIQLNADLKQISLKVAMLLGLLAAQRIQTIHLIDIRNIEFCGNLVKIRIGDLLKQSRPGCHVNEIVFEKYNDSSLCIVTFLQKYMTITQQLRNEENALFISFQKPYRKVTKDTIARWVKTVLHEAGIDTSIFHPHSIRAASVSQANGSRLPLGTILRTAGWSKESTFRKFYNKPITNDTSYAESILKTASDM